MRTLRMFVPLLLILAMGCEGLVAEPPARPFRDEDEVIRGVQPAPQSRVPRLTHRQYENSVRDLLGLDASLGLAVGWDDTLPGGAVFDNPGGALLVDETQFDRYQAAAADAAQTATSDPAILDRIDPSGDAGTFIREMGLRTHRRPLTGDEESEYMTVYSAASGLYGSAVDDRTSGVRLVLEAMLQSPGFLYRQELSRERDGNVIPLDGYEVASRLSYALWNSVPDDELLQAAEAGELTDPENVATQARRMLDDARAEETIIDYHRQLFGVTDYVEIDPDASIYDDAAALRQAATQEHDLFVTEIALTREGTYGELLTSQDTFVNDRLAEIYGVDGTFDETFQQVTLDPTQRRGFFTHVGFLAVNATSRESDPIHRGAFLAERIACVHINAPPDDLPPPPVIEGATNRQTIEMHTEAPGSICAGCHSQIINPFGFPFESYDAIGAWRDTDNGQPVDTTGAPPVDGTATPVDDARGLADALATSVWTHQCYAKHWIEYTHGRHSLPTDEPLITEIGERSAAGELTIKELIVAVVSSRSFLYRSTRENY